jgi:predicted lipoprotein with Yx(FWY)xxD motif
MKKHLRLLASLIIPAFVLILAACGTQTGSDNGYGSANATTPTATPASSGTTPPTTGGAVIKTESVTLNGKTVTALADSRGWTLYYFTPDNTATTTQCTGACATAWPPVTSPNGTPTSADKLPGKLGTQQNANGVQVTYNGHLCYTYAADGGPGMTTGEGANNGKWHVITSDLAAVNLGS